MSNETINKIILEKLETLTTGQKDIETNIATILERIDQNDKQYCNVFDNIKNDIEKGVEGRRVLHQKQDDIDKKIEDMKPEILFVKSVRKNINKIIGWAVLVIIIGIVLTAVPKIIEVIK